MRSLVIKSAFGRFTIALIVLALGLWITAQNLVRLALAIH
jgi:hypothetical protein